MDTETKDFLLKEYEQVWAFSRELHGTRNKAVALYLALLGAVASAAFTVASRSDYPCLSVFGGVFFGQLIALPVYLVLVSHEPS